MVGNLIISRKENETIKVGESIVITVTRIRGDRVLLAIEAPTEVHILRGELAQRQAGGGGE